MSKLITWVAVLFAALMLTACGDSGSSHDHDHDHGHTHADDHDSHDEASHDSDAHAVEELTASTPAPPASEAQVTLDPDLHAYASASGVSGSMRSIGSDTMNNIMAYWAGSFRGFYPSVKIEVEGKGSSTAPPALAQGQAQFGPMSRAMKQAEIQAFENEHGYKPTQLRTGIDCLAVFVHKDNPIESVTMDQIREAFSVDGPEMTWADLGVTDPEWAGRRIDLYGRNSASGTYGYFKKVGLGESDYKPTVKEQPGSSAVVQAIGRDRYAMGYSGLGYQTQDVRPLPILVSDEMIGPTADNAYSGVYPLARFLYVYVAADPRKDLDPLRAEFIKLIFSREGQEAVLKDGYFPISAKLATEQLKALGLDG